MFSCWKFQTSITIYQKNVSVQNLPCLKMGTISTISDIFKDKSGKWEEEFVQQWYSHCNPIRLSLFSSLDTTACSKKCSKKWKTVL